MIEITDKKDCCGCTACFNACPVNAIIMNPDEEGFLYPCVETQRCIQCNYCDLVCPIKNKKEKHAEVLEAFAVQHCDDEALYSSAAGGAFSAIGEKIISQGGIVYGARYDGEMVVIHSKATSVSKLKKFRSSKYVQSKQGRVYKEIKDELAQGKYVCYSGTPCQVAGLKSFLEKEYENLFTVDLACKGVGSPEVLRQYVELMQKKHGSAIVGMNFKRKTYGYHSSTMSVDFADGKSYSRGGITDLMMRSFRANICLRPSCEKCQFKGTDRVSDITIFDCWHYSQLTGKPDDDKGHTSVLVNTQKGLEMINASDVSLKVEAISSESVVNLDGVMVCGTAGAHEKRRSFMRDLNRVGLEKAVKNNIPITFKDIILDNSKGILYKLGILSTIKKLKSSVKIR